MINVYRKSHTYNYEIDISVDEWKKILCLPEIQENDNILFALEKWYCAPNYTASCKSLQLQYGKHSNFFSVQNRRLGQYAVKYLNRFRLIGEYDKESYWGVPWIVLKREKGIFILRLRSELVDAIKELGLFVRQS